MTFVKIAYSFGRQFLLCFCLFALALTETYADEDKPGQYDAFLWHLSAGIGLSEFVDETDGPRPYTQRVKSNPQALEFDLGYAFSPNWIFYLGGSYVADDRVEYEIENEKRHPEFREKLFEDRYQVSLREFSREIGLCYYFLPEYWYALFAVQSVDLYLGYELPATRANYTHYYGTGVKLGFGKEWWLADHATLGLGFVYRYVDIASYANDDFRENEKIKDGSYSYYGISLSLGYDP